MQLTLTFMSEKYSFQKDIMVNSRQSIGETIQILTEAGYITQLPGKGYRVRSLRTQQFVLSEKSYEQSGIYYGIFWNFPKLSQEEGRQWKVRRYRRP